ncbi:MAG: hypothetical protein ACPL3E_01840, partial [Minisyncoccia bacterium]
QFDGAVLITPQVIEDILNLTGPIEINETNPKIVFNADNFLIELQKIVEEKRTEKNKEPKEILDIFSKKILEKLSMLSSEEKKTILNYGFNWLQNKDLVFYFKDKNLQSFFRSYNFTGESKKLEPDFFGDYLAVVDANPASGKSDIFIQKEVNLKIQISNNGILNNESKIKRKNLVKNNDSWWYKLPNKDFVQIFTPLKTNILNVVGGQNKKIYPRINYQKNEFGFDPDLSYEKNIKIIEAFPQIKNYSLEDKNIFASWLETLPQNTSSLKLEYSRNLFKTPKSGDNFVFILEKQIGDRGKYFIEINAPIGFKFKENNSAVFEYQTENSARTEIINLTLIEDI